jgi:hypothetical protein
MINFAEIQNGETWELFARDFLTELGFYIESTPDRGADAGKDFLVSEELKGNLGLYKFRWLVSCKHKGVSGKSVTENDEQNILERVQSFNADGFLGIYSTVPSSGLNNRLLMLRDNLKIKDFRIFDYKLVENHLIRVGYSRLLLRYLPESYKIVRPLTLIETKYLPLECRVCKKDLLESLFKERYKSLVGYVENINRDSENQLIKPRKIEEIYWACKGEHDRQIRNYFKDKGKMTSWIDLDDLVIPLNFVRFIFAEINSIRNYKREYSDIAFEQLRDLIISLSQKVLRETTENEVERVKDLIALEGL